MKRILKLVPMCVLFFGSLSVLAQSSEVKDYLNLEQIRIQNARKIATTIDDFVINNLKSYNLSQSAIDEIVERLNYEGIPSQAQIDNAILSRKKAELRALYFSQNPNIRSQFRANPLPVTQQIECVNGGFEDASAAGYTFSHFVNPPLVDSAHVVCDTDFNQTTLIEDIVPLVNDFWARSSLICSTLPGYIEFEPRLLALNPAIEIPTVLDGNTSIKLNHSTNDDAEDVVQMSRNFVVDEATIDFNLSLIVENPGHPANGQPFFRARVLDLAGNVIDQICILSDPTNCLFSSLPPLNPNGVDTLYTGWICARLNVGEEHIGQEVTVEFMVGDCVGQIHQGWAYIDNICGITCRPTLGSINLEPTNINCPDTENNTPFDVCGTYVTPANSTLSSLILTIIQNDIVVGTINTATVLTSDNFCFSVDPSLFGANPSGNFEFSIDATFDVTCRVGIFNYTISDESANVGPDVSFNDCCLPTLTLTSANNMNNSLPDATIHRERQNWISASNIIGFGNNLPQVGVVYHAGWYVDLTPGFDAILTSQFEAYPEGCSTIYEYKHNDGNSVNNAATSHESNLVKISRDLIISPNPSKNFIDLTIKNDTFNKIIIASIDGKIILDKTIESTSSYNLDISSYASGVYIVNVVSSEGKQYSQKLLKN